ncbi:hypothetical protein GHT73_09570 [Pseudomonas aeruginosa]|nr:hypothetical protein [Pseudomonas aeruginosa]
MNKANECTCPSGDGSLRWPCPAHPEQQVAVAAKLTFINGSPAMCGCQVEYSDGGGEYSDVIYVTLCAKHSGSAILDLVATNRIALTPEYEGQWHADLYLDREIPLAKVEGATPAEAVLALMSAERIDPEQESVEQAGGDERAADRRLSEEAESTVISMVEYCLNARVCLGMDEGFKSFDPEVEHDFVKELREFVECRAALAQPSPTPELAERGTQHRFSTTEQTCQHDFYGVWWNDNGVTKTGRECRHCGFFVADAPEVQAEAERPELWAVHAQGPDELYAAFTREDAEKHAAELNALPMPEGIAVGAVVVPSPWPAVQHWQYLAEQEQDHKNEITGRLRQLERICEGLPQVEALRAELQSQRERNTELIFKLGSATNGWGRCEKERDAALSRVAELEGTLTDWVHEGFRLNEALAVAQAQHSVPDGAADLCRFLAKLYCELDGLRYSTAKLPAEQIADALIFKWPVLQGARNQLNIKRISEQPYDESKLHSAIAAMLAAAPGKEGA